MRPAPRFTVPTFLSLAGLGALALMTACTGSQDNPAPTPTGTVDFYVTDAPSDGWQAVEVVIKSITLINKADATKEVVAFQGNSTKVNLVSLDEIGEILAKAEVPAGTYDRMRITIDTAPGSIHLVRADGTHVPESKVKVVGDSVVVAMSPELVVTAGSSEAVQVDFDLSHPLFLVETPAGDVVLNLRLFHRPNAARFGWGHFRPTAGQITQVSPGTQTFSLTNRFGKSLSIAWDSQTIFWNADTRPISAGNADGLVKDKYVLVQLNLTANGTWLARRVWYTADPAILAKLISPEGHVLAVDGTAGTLTLSQATGLPRTIFVDSDTAFAFRDGGVIGTGPATLSKIHPGFKVHVEVKDPQATDLHAARVLVQRAVDGGLVKSPAGSSSFTFLASATRPERTYGYAAGFSWWPFANPAAVSTATAGFQAAVATAQDIPAAALTGLTWSGGAWTSNTLILTPVPLPKAGGATGAARITSPYNAATHQFAMGFPTAAGTATKTLTLSDNPLDQVQTVVWKIVFDGTTVTHAFVPSASWSTELTAAASSVHATVVPMSDGSLKAYTVVVFWDDRP